MYTQFFRLTQAPFSISPDPRYLFMSERHREALAHLLYGVDSGGGLVLLTGDIGTGKTTICRCFLEQVPDNCNVAYIFNPKLSVNELLQSICVEFHIGLSDRHQATARECIDALNRYLLEAHADGRNCVLVIDEAQNLSRDVLEQLRLLTNLETNERKLLQIILIGQPELRTMLARPDLEQLAQRVIAHYHLTALSENETASYIQHRLATAGLTTASPFQPSLVGQVYRMTHGVPRRINLLCDRALLGAYARGKREIDRGILNEAGVELFLQNGAGNPSFALAAKRRIPSRTAIGVTAGTVAVVFGSLAWFYQGDTLLQAFNQGVAKTTAVADEGLKKALRISFSSPQAASSAPDGSASTTQQAAQTPATTTDATPVAASAPADGKDDPFAFTLRSEKDALRQLARFWNVTPPEGEPCETLKAGNVRCHKGFYGFGELRQLDRPSVLRLQDDDGRVRHAIVTGIGDTHAVLRHGAESRKVELAWLTSRFRGEFITLWRAPEQFDLSLSLGDEGKDVDWLAQQMARLGGSAAQRAGEPFGPRLQKQVRQFQQANGLYVDGVAGPVTVMHLNRVAGVAEPRLAVE